MKIHFIRHGLTNSNIEGRTMGKKINESLNEKGRQLVFEAAEKIPADFDIIFTSPLLRAYQTAEIIGHKLNLPIVAAEELAERDSGDLSGLLWSDVKEKTGGKVHWDIVKKGDFDFSAYGGEDKESVRERLEKFIQKIKTSHADKKVLAVTHGGILRVIHIMLGQDVPDLPNLSLHEFEV